MMNNADRRESIDATLVANTAAQLADIGRNFHQRGWVLGTSGNFSAVLQAEPLRLLITASGMDKGQLSAEQFVVLDKYATVQSGTGKPSDETSLHLTLIQQQSARAVLHTHSVWSTLLSDAFASQSGLTLTGWEMLKGLAGVRTHEHREWVPILENSQDMTALAEELTTVLREHPAAHGFLLRGHGLYTWGQSISEAKRHIEIFEFLFELTGRKHFAGGIA